MAIKEWAWFYQKDQPQFGFWEAPSESFPFRKIGSRLHPTSPIAGTSYRGQVRRETHHRHPESIDFQSKLSGPMARHSASRNRIKAVARFSIINPFRMVTSVGGIGHST